MATAQGNLDTANGEKTTATNTRDGEKASHIAALGEYDDAIEACNKATQLVTENLLVPAGSFLQRTPVMI